MSPNNNISISCLLTKLTDSGFEVLSDWLKFHQNLFVEKNEYKNQYDWTFILKKKQTKFITNTSFLHKVGLYFRGVDCPENPMRDIKLCLKEIFPQH